MRVLKPLTRTILAMAWIAVTVLVLVSCLLLGYLGAVLLARLVAPYVV